MNPHFCRQRTFKKKKRFHTEANLKWPRVSAQNFPLLMEQMTQASKGRRNQGDNDHKMRFAAWLERGPFIPDCINASLFSPNKRIQIQNQVIAPAKTPLLSFWGFSENCETFADKQNLKARISNWFLSSKKTFRLSLFFLLLSNSSAWFLKELAERSKGCRLSPSGHESVSVKISSRSVFCLSVLGVWYCFPSCNYSKFSEWKGEEKNLLLYHHTHYCSS